MPRQEVTWRAALCWRLHAGQDRTVRFGSAAKVLAKRKLKFYRISEWTRPLPACLTHIHKRPGSIGVICGTVQVVSVDA